MAVDGLGPDASALAQDAARLRLAERLAAARSLADVVDAAARDGRALVGARACVVTTVRGDMVEILGGTGFEGRVLQPWHRFPVSAETPLSAAVRSGQVVWVPPSDVPAFEALASLDVDVVLCAVPLIADGAALGALGLTFDAGTELDDGRRGEIESLGAPVAAALARVLSERASGHDRLALLAEAGRAMGAWLDSRTTLADVARLVVPAVADGCLVHLVEDDALTLVAVRDVDPAREATIWELGRRNAGPMLEVLDDVLASGESALLGPAVGEALVQGGVAVRLTSRGRPLGVLTLTVASDRSFCPEDVGFAEELAARVAVALDNALLYQQARDALADRNRLVAMLDALLWRAPIGLAFFDDDARYVRVNDCLAEINGLPAEAHLGRTVEEVVTAISPTVSDDIRRVAETGETVVERQVAGETPAAPGVLRHWLVTYFPVVDGGAPFAVGAIVVEITDRIRTDEERTRLLEEAEAARAAAEANERRLAFLAEASTFLATTLSSEEVFRRAAQLAVTPLDGVPFADYCTVDVVDDLGVHRVLAVAADPARATQVLALLDHTPGRSGSRVLHALRTGRPECGAVTPELLARVALDADHRELMVALGMRSYVVAPLVARGRVLGALTLTSTRDGQYGPDDVRMAADLAGRAALAVDNARLYESRSDVVRALSEALLPPALPEVPNLDLAVYYRPSSTALDIGGDFYDVFRLDDDAWAVVVGDVCGTGPEAASRTALVRHTARAVAEADPAPAAVLGRLNRALLADAGATRFCTVAYGVVRPSPDGVRLTLASAGHPLPLYVRPDGRVEALACPGQLLGVLDEPVFATGEVLLQPGAAVVLYTDGVVEARGSDGFFEEGRLHRVLRAAAGGGAQALVDAVADAVLAFTGGRTGDDVAVVALAAPR